MDFDSVTDAWARRHAADPQGFDITAEELEAAQAASALPSWEMFDALGLALARGFLARGLGFAACAAIAALLWEHVNDGWPGEGTPFPETFADVHDAFDAGDDHARPALHRLLESR